MTHYCRRTQPKNDLVGLDPITGMRERLKRLSAAVADIRAQTCDSPQAEEIATMVAGAMVLLDVLEHRLHEDAVTPADRAVAHIGDLRRQLRGG